jgi:hypothetical protein
MITRLSLAFSLLFALGACAAAPPPPLPAATAITGKTPLFNGKDLSGLTPVPADATDTWSVQNGVLRCSGTPTGYLRTQAVYENYRMRLQWRWPGGGGNNGVLLHIQPPDEVWPKSIEAQLEAQHAGDIWVIGGADFREHIDKSIRRVPKQEESSEKALGEWNEYLIECRGDTIKLFVNGILQNVATECTIQRGHIGLQSEGTPIEFREWTIEPLD